MRRLVFRAAARRDLLEIETRIAWECRHAPTARAFLASLTDRCARIAGLPGTLGRPRDELAPALRSVSHRGYVILFRYAEGMMIVIRVLHGQRDIAAQFGPPFP